MVLGWQEMGARMAKAMGSSAHINGNFDCGDCSYVTPQMTDLLTNSLSLPQPLVEAVRADDYDRGECDYTTTQLIRPVRINSLLQKHRDQICEDVSDRIWTLFGQAIHTVLERAKDGIVTDFITEERYFMKFPV